MFEIDEFKEVIRSGTYIVDFWVDDKDVHPNLESVAKELGFKKCYYIKVKSSVNKELCEKYKVTYVPTLIAFKGGREVSRIVGYKHER